MKTNELTGKALDYAVTLALNNPAQLHGRIWWTQAHGNEKMLSDTGTDQSMIYSPSRFWKQGGPIFEREISALNFTIEGEWEAETGSGARAQGPTPLIAAMRCYVASQLGDEVEIPEELMT